MNTNATATATTTATATAGSFKILTMIITGLFAAACLIFTAIICRIAFRLGNKPMQRLWVQRLRLRCAWAFNFAVWAVSCWVVVAYGRCLGRADTDRVIMSSLLGFSISWFIMEPLWIILIVAVPCLCDTRVMNTLNKRANDIGLDLSMLIG